MTVNGDNDADITTSLNLPKNSFPDIWTPSEQQLLEFQHSVAVPFALVPAPAVLAELPRIRSPEAAAPDEEAVLAQPAPLALLPFQRGAVDEGHVAFLDIEFKDDENDSDYEDEITDSDNDEVDFEKDDGDNAGLLVLVKQTFNLNFYSAVDLFVGFYFEIPSGWPAGARPAKKLGVCTGRSAQLQNCSKLSEARQITGWKKHSVCF